MAHFGPLSVLFLTPVKKSTNLVLPGSRLTIFAALRESDYLTWSYLWKVRKLRRTEQPATDGKDQNSLLRLLSATTEEQWKLHKFTSLLLERRKLRAFGSSLKNLFFLSFELLSQSGTKATFQRNLENSDPWKIKSQSHRTVN